MRRLVLFAGLLAVCLGIGQSTGRTPGVDACSVAPPGLGGATSLSLAPDLSFVDDSSSNFPIRGENLEEARIASDRPTAIFFGTSHCWNTNREAERFVKLYHLHDGDVRFLVVDVDRPSSGQKCLVASLFHGSIPTLAFLDRSGLVVYDEAGETSRERGDVSRLLEILSKASESR